MAASVRGRRLADGGGGRNDAERRRQGLTERQKKWFASVRGGLERDTGRSLEAWVAIARTCPETKRRARLAWFKAEHGLLQNRASYVLSEAFPEEEGVSWAEPDALREALWADPATRAVFEVVRARAEALPEVVTGQRKGYTAWSRKVQFAALAPIRKGGAKLGLALEPDADPRLSAPRNESWSERLHAVLVLPDAEAADDAVTALLQAAWARS